MTGYVAAIISSVVALIALIYTVKTQMNANIEKWMNLLRDALVPIFTQSEILRLKHKHQSGESPKGQIGPEELGDLNGKLRRVELLLDPDDEKQMEIITLSNKLAKNAENSDSSWDSFYELERSLIDKSQSLLKAHWKKIYKKEWERFLTIILAAFILTIIVSAVILVIDNKPTAKDSAGKANDTPSKIEIVNSPVNCITFSCDSVNRISKPSKYAKSCACCSRVDSLAKK
jgi:hypothetical protein